MHIEIDIAFFAEDSMDDINHSAQPLKLNEP